MLAYLLERELDKYWRHLEVTVAEGIDELGSSNTINLLCSFLFNITISFMVTKS